MTTNKEREKRAEAALGNYKYEILCESGSLDFCDMQDLIADLHHLSKKNKWNWRAMIRTAKTFFLSERRCKHE